MDFTIETSPMEISENIGSFLQMTILILCLMYLHSRMKKNLNFRYDMSVPLARFVAQNYRDLTFLTKDTYGDVLEERSLKKDIDLSQFDGI